MGGLIIMINKRGYFFADEYVCFALNLNFPSIFSQNILSTIKSTKFCALWYKNLKIDFFIDFSPAASLNDHDKFIFMMTQGDDKIIRDIAQKTHIWRKQRLEIRKQENEIEQYISNVDIELLWYTCIP